MFPFPYLALSAHHLKTGRFSQISSRFSPLIFLTMLFKSLLTTAVVSSLVSRVAADLPEIEIVGNKFFYSNNGSQFLMRGVAYQQDTSNSTSSSFVDPLADAVACARDIPYLEQLQTNVIRVYALNVSEDHTTCMQLLDAAGIYVIADLSQPDESIDREDPLWNTELFARYASVVDKFHNYTNILGFFAGNEVTNEISNTAASAFVKAAVRDTKAYIQEKGYRSIPVGYSANDDIDIRIPLAEFFACGDSDERADFFGINMYEWCGSSATFKTSGYSTITSEYKNLGIPIFFSEYGCNTIQPRKFTEVGTIYSSEMTDVWSGGIVYMYFEEANNYGLVTIDSNGGVSTLSDFNFLKSELASISPSLATANSASSAQSVTTCPAIGSDWQANTALPPTPDSDVCDCMNSAMTCVVDSSVDSTDYADLFAYVCGVIDCSGVTGNGTTAEYGAYSGCDAKLKLNFVLNLYYEEQGSSSSACDFSGSATTQSPATASSCKAVISSAGVSGLGTVSGNVAAVATTGSSGTKTSGSQSSGTSTGSSSSTTRASGGAVKSTSSSSVALMMIVSMAAVGFGFVLA